ncbi:type III-B CRISPR module-associated protein Cmr5 [Chromatium weissei]|nr:type III-B CRISPR module-associated protein Cmr5 [Chromatium weissei]
MTNYKKEQRKKEKLAKQMAEKLPQPAFDKSPQPPFSKGRLSSPSLIASAPIKTPPVRNNSVSTKTPEQERAEFALQHITDFAKNSDEKSQKEFNSYASSMPFMIHANGLGQTAAFYRRKGEKNTYYELYKLLGEWLAKDGRPFAGKSDLLNAITQSDQDAYLAAQIEALLFLDWVKKLASAFLAREENNVGEQQP